MRATPQVDCSDNDSVDNIRGIVYYGSGASIPNTTGYDYVDGCEDEDVSNLVPYVSKTVDSPTWNEDEAVTFFNGVPRDTSGVCSIVLRASFQPRKDLWLASPRRTC